MKNKKSSLLFLVTLALSGPAHAAIYYWDGTDNQSWNTLANWSTASGAITPNPTVQAGSSDDLVFHISTVNANRTSLVVASRSVKSMTFNSTGLFNIRANTSTSGTTTRVLTIGADGILKNTNSGAVNIGGGTSGIVQITLGVSQTWTNNSTAGALNIGKDFLDTTTNTTGGILALNGRQLTLDGAGDFQVGAAGTSNQALFGNSASSVIKQGAGTLTIGGANSSLAAPITVSGGTLYVTGSLGTSTVDVGANGTVGRNGATTNGGLGNSLTIESGGNLDLAGATLGASSTGILGMTSGTLTLEGLAFTDLLNWDFASASVGTYQLIEAASTVNLTTAFTSEETAFIFASGGNKGYFTTTGNSLNAVIVAVPEPSAALLGGLGAVFLLRRRRN